MRRSRLDMFINHVIGRPLPARAAATAVHSYFKGIWRDRAGATVADSVLLAFLNGARDGDMPIKNAAGTVAYVPLSGDLDSVVTVRCHSNYQATTLHKIVAALNAAVEFTGYAYAATHMTLTGLVNKEEFTNRLASAIAEAKAVDQANPSTPSAAIQPMTVSVIEFDLDHFKQVNDNYGHDYGDVVLKALALRLTRTMLNRLSTLPPLAWELGHLSGEEFALFLAGSLTPDTVTAVAEHLREAVFESPLPTNDDLLTVNSTLPPESVPHDQERRLTISIGIATEVIESRPERSKNIATRLMQHADTAMYRAKNKRNCVRRYDDILSSLGRVLEHHESPSMVAIDIGNSVGVSVGQEFLVFHPSFAGDFSFVVSDGRTSKKLGVYPRRSYATIVVDDVQATMSFCKVVGDPQVRIETGSHLEAIPLGTISRSVYAGNVLEANLSLRTPSQLAERTLALTESGSDVAILVFTLRDVDQLLSQSGTIAVNTALTRLYDSIRRRMSSVDEIGKTQTTELAVILRNGPDAIPFVAGVVSDFSEAVVGRAQLSVGGYQKSVYDASKAGVHSGDASVFEPESWVDLARYAAASSAVPNILVNFTPMVATSILSRTRLANKFRETLSDFDRLKHLGLVNPYAYNQAAISAMSVEPRQADLAADYMANALRLDPNGVYLVANMAWLHMEFGLAARAADELIRAYGIDRKVLDYSDTYCYVLYRILREKPDVARHFAAKDVQSAFAKVRRALASDADTLASVAYVEEVTQPYLVAADDTSTPTEQGKDSDGGGGN